MPAESAVSYIERETDSRTRSRYRVSALVSVYRSQIYLEGLLQDLLAQTLYARDELEIVVVDSHSPDDEDWRIVDRYANVHPHIRAIRTLERETLYQAWNRGISESRGEYLTNANTDDRHASNAFETLASELDNYPEVDLVYADVLISRIPNAPFHEVPAEEYFRTPSYVAPHLLLYYSFGPQPMWRKSVHSLVGTFDGSLKAAGDWDFGLRLARQCRAKRIPQALGAFLVTEDNISFRDSTMRDESLAVMNQWQTPENVERMYRMEGIVPSDARSKAEIRLDMGVRALEFVNPLGGRRRHLQFALNCFQQALELAPNWGKAINNLGVTLSLAGQAEQAARLFEQAGGMDQCPEAKANLRRLREALNPMDVYAGLRPSFSTLCLPTTFDAAAGRTWNPQTSPKHQETASKTPLIARKDSTVNP